MTIAVDLGRKANKQTNKQTIIHGKEYLGCLPLLKCFIEDNAGPGEHAAYHLVRPV